jgi:ribonuclease P protein component
VTDVVAAIVQPPVRPVRPGRPGRLTRPADVQRALRRGRSRSGELLAVHVIQRPEKAEPTRLTVVASRRVGGAVSRNRAKRLLREAARAWRWDAGLDVVLVARSACAQSDLHQVRDELGRLGRGLGVLETAP